jgi:dipeptidyl aminopeptidase/acylaminoacyl peptidase
MAGVDAAIAKGFIDDRNLFVCGGSGGGVLTAWIVGHTDRFAGAVSMRPVINWHSFVGNTDGSMWYSQFQKYPWEDPMEYAVRSPLHYVANVKTPTMVMTGEADLRTPMTQSEEFYRAEDAKEGNASGSNAGRVSRLAQALTSCCNSFTCAF